MRQRYQKYKLSANNFVDFFAAKHLICFKNLQFKFTYYFTRHL